MGERDYWVDVCDRCLKAGAGSWQRTFLDSLRSSLTASTGSATSWRQRATPSRRRCVWAPVMSAPRTDETGCGSSGDWPTPRASENEQRTRKEQPSVARGHGKILAAEVLKDWPTPTAEPYGTNQGGSSGRVGPIRPSLETLATWPTPTVTDANGHGYQRDRRGYVMMCLPGAVGGAGLPGQVSPNMIGNRRARLNPRWVETLMGFPVGWLAVGGSAS